MIARKRGAPPHDLGADLDSPSRYRPEKEGRRRQQIGKGHLSAQRLQGDGQDVAAKGLAVQSVPAVGDGSEKPLIADAFEVGIGLKD
jgi:hypothetical protein